MADIQDQPKEMEDFGEKEQCDKEDELKNEPGKGTGENVKIEDAKETEQKLDKNMIIAVLKAEFETVSKYTLIPAVICTFHSALGYDPLVSIILMSVLTGYVIHKKQLKGDVMHGFRTPIAMTRYATLVAIFFLSSVVAQFFPSEDGLSNPGWKNVLVEFLKLHSKITGSAAMYRIYLSIFGVMVGEARINLLKKNTKKLNSEKLMGGDGDGKNKND